MKVTLKMRGPSGKYKCTCSKWFENIKKINSYLLAGAIHGLGDYSGDTFIYCPFCGKKTKEDKPDDKE